MFSAAIASGDVNAPAGADESGLSGIVGGTIGGDSTGAFGGGTGRSRRNVPANDIVAAPRPKTPTSAQVSRPRTGIM
jgi:hypothetical protein